ncbi:MAG: DUF6036 family nucleotidyltransferase [Candidatus Binatia bacterium]
MLNRLRDVFASFQSHDVRYVVIGGIAAVLHGVPRATFDLDILIEATEPNAERLLQALRTARFATADLIDAQGLLANEITVFNDRVRIDVQTATPGLLFADAWSRRETMAYQGQEFSVASRQDVIASKRAAGRQKDLEDVRVLELGPEKPS